MSTTKLRLATFNTFTAVPEPIRFTSQRTRLQKMTPILSELEDGEIDTWVFCEAMVSTVQQDLIRPMARAGWCYCTKSLIPDSPVDLLVSGSTSLLPVVVSGGVFIVSRWRIVAQAQHIFDHTIGSDSLSAKGVVYACIEKQGKRFHVIGTHLQAWKNDDAMQVRAQQAVEISRFVHDLKIPAHEPLLLGGDLNIDFYQDTHELQSFLGRTCMYMPPIRGIERYSVSKQNHWVGLDDPSQYQNEDWPDGCYDITLDTMFCVCCENALVDYWCVSRRHQPEIPGSGFLTVYPLRVEPYSAQVNFSTKRTMEFLSDHSVIVGHFEFVNQSATTPENKTIPGRSHHWHHAQDFRGEHRCLSYPEASLRHEAATLTVRRRYLKLLWLVLLAVLILVGFVMLKQRQKH